jgi:hypothetical protein
MMGQHNSVSSRFKEMCPGISVYKCICHSLHICGSEACKKLPRSLEDLARNVYHYLKSSAKRQCALAQFQKYCNLEIHKILHPYQTRHVSDQAIYDDLTNCLLIYFRWLSLVSVVTRMLEQWPALQLYFNEQWLELKLVAAEHIHQWLNDPFMKLHYQFLEWVLPKITRLNELFQRKEVIVTKLQSHCIFAQP